MDQPMVTIDVNTYGGKQVAIFRGAIVAVGSTSREVLARAHDRFPDEPLESFGIFAVPRTLHCISVAALSVRHRDDRG